MRSFVRFACTGLLIGGATALVNCGGDDTTGTTGSSGAAGTGGSDTGSGGSNGTSGSTSSGGSAGASGSTTGAGGSSGSGTGGSSQPDSGAGGTQKDGGSATDGPGEAQAAYNPCPAKGTPCAVMGLGDSITDGAGSSTGGSYRTFLYQLALSHQQTITLVGNNMTGPNMVNNPLTNMQVAFPKGNEGHSGYTIDDGGGRTGIHALTVPAMNKFHPNIITLMIGTNDTDIMLDLPNAPMRLGALMDDILAADANVLLVVAQIVPTKDDTENIRVKAYNDAIPGLVKTRADAGKHVITVDMYGGFQADANYKTDYMNDNLHPKDPGYSKMADIWYAAIGPLFR